MPELIETLSSLLPPSVLRRLAADPDPIRTPEGERFPGSVLFADISGFTALAEDLANHGPAGIETLSALLNTYFGRLIELVSAHGGEVVQFAGDGLLALWSAARGVSLGTASFRAAQCALAIQQTLHAYQVAPDRRMSVRVAIGAGEVFLAHVGGVAGRWEFLAAGAPFSELATVLPQAQPGDVVMTPAAFERVGERCHGRVLAGGAVRIESTLAPALVHAAPSFALPARAEAAMNSYLPGAVLARVSAGQVHWMAELRRASVLFVSLRGIAFAAPDALDRIQAVAHATQTVLGRYEGSLSKILCDDKGTVLVSAFGLPPLAHEDDPSRAVQAALALSATLDQLGVGASLGIATGQVFCGMVGSDLRREYTILGDTVNLAARLMQAADGGILCDAVTHHASRASVVHDELPPVLVKGKALPVAVWRPRGLATASTPRDGGTIGRAAERTLLEGKLGALAGGQGGVVWIEGEAGIGKSRLCEDLLGMAAARGLAHAVATGDAISRSAAYQAWQPILVEVLGLGGLDAPARRVRVTAALPLGDGLLLPLLDQILGLEAPDSELTAQMAGQVRADNTHALIIALLAAATARAPWLVVLEDAHWMDSASWLLAALAARQVAGLLLVVITRPLGAKLPTEQAQLVEAAAGARLVLGPLTADDTAKLVCQRLGVRALPEPVLRLIIDKAEGHPFFSEELAVALRDAGVLRIDGADCTLDRTVRDLEALRFPDTVQGVITSRIDRLGPSEQLALKVASVIGRTFRLLLLRSIHPVEADKAGLEDTLAAIVRGELVTASPPPDPAYLFKHAITHEVAYNLMLFSQRRQLHRAIAEWYEASYASALAPHYPLLAHHFGLAEDAAKAIEYLEKAGEASLTSGGYREATSFFARVLALDDGQPPGQRADRLRRARWQRQLGEAHWGLGDLPVSAGHMSQSLALLARPIPRSRAGWVLSLLAELARQAWHRVLGRAAVARSARTRSELIEAAHATQRVAERLYFARQPLSMLAATLKGLNLAERAGPAKRMSRHYAFVGMMMQIGNLPRIARACFRRATAVASEVNDLDGLAYVRFARGLGFIGAGDWEVVDEELAESLLGFRRLGDRQELQITRTLQALAAYYRGRFEAAHGLFVEIGEAARAAANVQHEAWGWYGMAEALLPQGRADQALELLERAERILDEHPDHPSEIICYGLLAITQLGKGNLVGARRAADAAFARISDESPTVFSTLEGYAGTAATYLGLWQRARRDAFSDQQALLVRAREACRRLGRFAARFPIGLPRARLLEGRMALLSGRTRAARRAFERSLAAAQALAMPYEQALAHLELGQAAALPARRAHLERALGLARELGCHPLATTASDLLEKT